MLPTPVLVLDDGSAYMGLFLTFLVAGVLSAVAQAVVFFNVIERRFAKIYAASIGGLAALALWLLPAIGITQYPWFEWYDAPLFIPRIVITPEYYTDGPAFGFLVIPAILTPVLTVSAIRLLVLVIRAPAANAPDP